MNRTPHRILIAVTCALGLWVMSATSHAQHASPHDATTVAGQWRVDLAGHHNLSRGDFEWTATRVKGR